jgi:hypothetical protein
MSEERDFLKEHAGRCLFPLVEKGRKELCNAMTFKVDGSFPPFCEQHLTEVRRSLEYIKTKNQSAGAKKKMGFKGSVGK